MSVITTPFAWLLTTFYNLLNNYGLALILFGLILSLIRLPFDVRSKRSQMKTGFLAPKMQKLKDKHGDNTPKYNEELQKLYKEENVNPLSGCLWTLIPLAILMILYSVVRQPLTYLMGLSADQIELIIETMTNLGVSIESTTGAWSEIYIAQAMQSNFAAVQDIPGVFYLNLDFFGGINLGNIPQWNFFMQSDWVWQDLALFLLPIISVAVSFVSQKVSTATSFQQQDPSQQGTMKTMMIIGPLISLYVGFAFPAALGLYWLSQNTFMTIFTFFINRRLKKTFDAEMEIREEKERLKEAELEAKRLETERLKQLGATAANKNTSKKKIQKTEKQKEAERLAAAEKRDKSGEEEPSRIGNRRNARGRAYDPNRFGAEGIEPENEDDTVYVEADNIEAYEDASNREEDFDDEEYSDD